MRVLFDEGSLTRDPRLGTNRGRVAAVCISLSVAVSTLGGLVPVAAVSAATQPTTGTSTVETQATTDPVIAAVGDIACDPAHTSFNGGSGTSNSCRQKYTSDLAVNQGLAAVLALGDNQYYCGGYNAYLGSYDLSWGRVKPITYPAVGNHEYLTAGGSEPSTGCDTTNAGAAGHYKYFADRLTACTSNCATSGDPSKGYYSFDVGTWHMIMLNSTCSGAGGCSATSPQGKWLRTDLASHSNVCTLAFWHVPLFSSGGRDDAAYKTFWDALYQYGADVVLNGHDHTYERFAPQTPEGVRNDALGIREFVVGSGGSNHTSFVSTVANSEVRNSDTYGILKLTLRPQGYDWQFVPEVGKTFTDAGTDNCHGTTADTTPPSAPTNVSSTAVGGGRVDLTWTASTDNVGVTGYKVFRDGLQIATSATTSYSDKTVQPNTSYSYHVAAYDGAQNTSAPSATTTVTTGPPDEQVTFAVTADAYVQQDLATTNFGAATSIDVDSSPLKNLLMKFNVSGLTGRKITGATLRVYCIDSSSVGGEFRRVADQTWSEGTVTWNNAPTADPTVLGALGGVSANAWFEADVGSLVSGDGSVSLRASSSSMDGARYSSKEGAAGFAPQLVVSVAANTTPPPDTTPPSAPANLTATAASSSQVDLSWTASTDNVGVTGYKIYRGTTEIATSTMTSYSDRTVAPSTTYSYTVKAYDAANNLSAASNSASVTTPAATDTTPPSAPANLTATAASSSQVDLSWSAST
ncbi:MAG: DNRLRE domain-containing protein, partial [Chloroflexota bacterium]|nr:DNRLRE domain-containing protein [Chloroflexota bacterium]